MIVEFDPVACEVTIDMEDGQPPRTIPQDRVLVSYYANTGVIVGKLNQEGIEVRFVQVLDEPMRIAIDQTGPVRWKVNILPEV